jgi:hypothetical protein
MKKAELLNQQRPETPSARRTIPSYGETALELIDGRGGASTATVGEEEPRAEETSAQSAKLEGPGETRRKGAQRRAKEAPREDDFVTVTTRLRLDQHQALKVEIPQRFKDRFSSAPKPSIEFLVQMAIDELTRDESVVEKIAERWRSMVLPS